MKLLLRLTIVTVLFAVVGIATSAFTAARTWWNAMYPSGEYAQACKFAGVTYRQAPRTAVRSVALDYQPVSATREWRRYEFGSNNIVGLVGSTSWQPRMEEQLDRFEMRSGYYAAYPKSKPFYRWERALSTTPTGEDEISSDVFVLDTVTHVEELDKALWQQGMIQHQLTVTDRRNGDQLATMTYVLDLANRRACGANTDDAIDVDAFVLRATKVPIVIPKYERDRLDAVAASKR